MITDTVLAVFPKVHDADNAITELRSMGYSPNDMSIITRQYETTEQVADNSGATVADGAVAGATTGAAIGALAGLLAGIGAITIPGIGALIATGPLAAALGLTGAAATTVTGAATGVVAGGLLGALANLGLSQDTAKLYEERIREGATVIAVPVERDHVESVAAMFQDNRADQVDILHNQIPLQRDQIDYQTGIDTEEENVAVQQKNHIDHRYPQRSGMYASGTRRRVGPSERIR